MGAVVTAKLLSSKSGRLIVRNLAFSCTEEMLHAAFAVHGTIKSITLPRKDDNTLKGFAFVEYADETDATTAIAKCVQFLDVFDMRMHMVWSENMRDRQTETDRQRQIDRQLDRQTDRQTDTIEAER